MQTVGVRVATYALGVALGAVYGTAGTVSQGLAPLGIPVGLVLALVGLAALLIAMRLLTASRWAALATGLGATAAAVLFSGTGPGGSVLAPSGAIALTWTIAVPVLTALTVAWPEMTTFVPSGRPTDRAPEADA